MSRRSCARRALAGLAGWVAASAATPARAQAPVPIEVEACQELLSGSAVQEALEVELRGAEPQVWAYIGRARPRARIRCQGDDIAVQVISDDGVALRESVRAERLGLTRFVAIAIAESLAARAVEPAPAPPPPPVAVVTPPGPAPPLPVARARPPLVTWLSAGGAVSWGGTPSWRSGGGTIGVDLVVRSVLTVHLDAGLVTGGLDVDVGHVDAREPTAALGARLGRDLRWLRLEAGACLRGGAVVWSGRPTDATVTGRSAVTPWLGPAAELALSAHLSRRLRLQLHAEAGRPLASASAEGLGMRFARLDPLWVSSGLALAVRLTP